MIKKLIAFTILIAALALSTSIVHAQRGIDPTLKPGNAPGVPDAGMTKDQCIKKYTGIPIKYDAEKEEYVVLTGADLEKAVWDENGQICVGESASEPINAFLQILGGALLMLSGGIAVIVIAVGGFMYITSRGNQQQMEYAKNTLVYGVLGMLVVIFSYFIVSYVINLVVGTSG
ncbi:pilin [Patescibacteria group bacterium]